MSVLAYFIDAETPLLSRRPQYPATFCKLEYFDEGGANIIWRISVNEGVQAPAKLQKKLLRIRKNVRHAQTAKEQLQAFDDNFKNLFPQQNVIQHELIRLDDGIISALNELLRQRIRPSHRAHDFLPTEEQHGILITDMSAESKDEVLIQLKPKWLIQSANAPAQSRRCRTCALRAQRLAKKIGTATDEQRHCPLMLINDTPALRLKAAESFVNDKQCARFLAKEAYNLLLTLRDQQAKLDQKGVLKVNGVDDIFDLCRAMTLRDCTLYIKRSSTGIQARLGDLDLKQPEKLTNWKTTEKKLIDEGWYENTEAESHATIEVICALSSWPQTG